MTAMVKLLLYWSFSFLNGDFDDHVWSCLIIPQCIPTSRSEHGIATRSGERVDGIGSILDSGLGQCPFLLILFLGILNSHHHNKYRDEISPFLVGWCSNHWDIETNPCGHGNQHPARHGLRTTFGAGSGCFQRIPWPESWHVARSWFSTEKPKDLFFFYWSQSLNQIHFFHVQKGKIFRSF